MKLSKILETILNEVGEGTSKPYKWVMMNDDERYQNYGFETDSGLNYRLDLDIQEGDEDKDSAIVSFGVMDDDYFVDYDVTTNKGELYRIMATVVDILKDFIKNNKDIKYLQFTADKGGLQKSQRSNLYLAYINKHLPGATIERGSDKDDGNYERITIKLPRNNRKSKAL